MEGSNRKNNSAEWVGKYRILAKRWTCGVKSEFFVLDLKQEIIVTKHPEVVWSRDEFTTTAVLHEDTLSVVNIGVRKYKNSKPSKHKPYYPIMPVNPEPEEEEDNYIHSSDSNTCVSTLDLTKSPAIWSNWTPGPKMIFKRESPYSAVLDKMIFACSGTRLNSRILEGYQIGGSSSKWEETTIIPFGGDLTLRDPAWVSIPPIPDPNNNRLIVFFENTDSLYAYYPSKDNNNNWELLHQPFHGGHWFFSASAIANQVVGDNLILCFYPDSQIFLAYNIITNKWLDVHWLFKFDDTQQTCLLYGIELFHLGNDILCLAASRDKFHIEFLRFSVKLVQEQQLVQLTPLSFHSIFVPDILAITDTFIPF
ncbi:uncharacterized protein LOC123916668 [Trifolium pratense]|uniref:uncharacterized protein LOC123916668 n=1 Tax=Trifolium pratense TaxID=57577 RepID=UPI001E6955EE|nr:uncharacterized protein LOC123916668 [Trifolium pratense]